METSVSPRRRVVGLVWKRLPEGLGVLLVLLAANRLGLRDRVPLLATACYAFPPIMLTFLSLAAAGVSGLQRKWKWTTVFPCAALVFFGWHVAYSYRSNEYPETPPSAQPFRVVFWNVSSGSWGWDGVVEELAAADADLIGLVESRSEEAPAWEASLPDHRVLRLDGNITVLGRGVLRLKSEGSLGSSSRYVRFEFIRDGRTWDVVLADLTSNPFRSRGAPLSRLWEIVDPLRSGPLVIMGDFNTPRSSVHFDRWEKHLTHAFGAAGRGFSETWPGPLPVLDLDHVWCGGKVRILDCRLERTWASDHRRVVTELSRIE